jgi:hypothetical protein
MTIGISLGWNCYSAMHSVDCGDRDRKSEGYKTCPFDMCLTNYSGIVKCIRDDFKEFMDVEISEIPENANYMAEDTVIYNKHYNFIFNHESPHHKNLWITEKWEGGKGHFADNKFKKFIERYTNRIDNFRNYLQSGEKILFIITKENQNLSELHNALRERYPNLYYSIKRLDLEQGTYHYYSHLDIMGCRRDIPELL